MRNTRIIITYILLFSLLLTIFFLIPKKIFHPPETEKMISSIQDSISFYRVSDCYEEQEDQNKRLFTVYVARFTANKSVWMQIFDYANKLPLTREGYTAVFFFDSRENTPEIDYFTEGFEPSSESRCVAGYWKYSNGTDIFRQYPFE